MLAERVLRKHVAIIHAYSMMSTLQRKVFNILLYQAIDQQNKLIQNESISIECNMSFADLINAIHFNSNNTQYLKESIDGLASLKIEWNLLKDKVPSNVSFLNLRILHGSPTFFQNGTFTFSFHKLLLEFVGNPDIYGTIDINLQAAFESKYGHALYENSTRFVNMQKGKIIQLDTLRKLLGVNNEKYQNMRELTRNVIKPAIEEVNDRAGFVVDLQPLRVGKKISSFQLTVNPKLKNVFYLNEATEKNEQNLVSEITKNFGKISELVLKNILVNYSYEYIFQKINYTKEHVQKDESGFYPIAYFISALKNDYKNSEKNLENSKDQSDKIEEQENWQERLQFLYCDLAHWKRNLQLAQKDNNKILIQNINKIIAQCEKSLEQHLLVKPKIQPIIEAD